MLASRDRPARLPVGAAVERVEDLRLQVVAHEPAEVAERRVVDSVAAREGGEVEPDQMELMSEAMGDPLRDVESAIVIMIRTVTVNSTINNRTIIVNASPSATAIITIRIITTFVIHNNNITSA